MSADSASPQVDAIKKISKTSKIGVEHDHRHSELAKHCFTVIKIQARVGYIFLMDCR